MGLNGHERDAYEILSRITQLDIQSDITIQGAFENALMAVLPKPLRTNEFVQKVVGYVKNCSSFRNRIECVSGIMETVLTLRDCRRGVSFDRDGLTLIETLLGDSIRVERYELGWAIYVKLNTKKGVTPEMVCTQYSYMLELEKATVQYRAWIEDLAVERKFILGKMRTVAEHKRQEIELRCHSKNPGEAELTPRLNDKIYEYHQNILPQSTAELELLRSKL